MSFTLEGVVPWGRSFAEYGRMFNLNAADLGGGVVGCGDGPASFGAEAARRGWCVVACDPLYQFSAGQIRRRIGETYGTVMAELTKSRDQFVWREFADPAAVGRARRAAMEAFLADYPAGRRAGRYVAAALPALPFGGGAFGLALCSHFLFLYADHLSLEFHLAAIGEMLRVAREARIFPLVDLAGRPAAQVEPVPPHFERLGGRVAIEPVPYEFQRGANRMMRIFS